MRKNGTLQIIVKHSDPEAQCEMDLMFLLDIRIGMVEWLKEKLRRIIFNDEINLETEGGVFLQMNT